MISVQRFEDLMVPKFFWFDFSAVDGRQWTEEGARPETLTVGGVLVEHEGVAGLNLSLQDGVPKLLSLDRLLRLARLLVLVEQSSELVAVHLVQSRGLGRTEQRPVASLLDALHEEIGDPEGEEQVAGANLLLAVILAEVEELEDVGVPGLEVDGKRSWALVASLIDVAGRVVVHAKHGDDSVRVAIRACDVGSRRTDVVDREADASRRLGDEGASLERVVDSLD
jgi:hypothetical protein